MRQQEEEGKGVVDVVCWTELEKGGGDVERKGVGKGTREHV